MDILERAAKICEIQPKQLFREICDSNLIEKRRRIALWTGYETELFLPPFIELSCDAILAGTIRRPQI